MAVKCALTNNLAVTAVPGAYPKAAEQVMLVEELFYGQDLHVPERAIDLLRANLTKRLSKAGAQTEAAADAKISLSYLNQLFTGRRKNPGLDKIDQIANALDAPVAALFLSEGVTLSDRGVGHHAAKPAPGEEHSLVPDREFLFCATDIATYLDHDAATAKAFRADLANIVMDWRKRRAASGQ